MNHCSNHTKSNTGSLPSCNGLLEGCSNHTMSNTALLHPQGMLRFFAACQHPRIPIFHRLRIPTSRHSDITAPLHHRLCVFLHHRTPGFAYYCTTAPHSLRFIHPSSRHAATTASLHLSRFHSRPPALCGAEMTERLDWAGSGEVHFRVRHFYSI